MTMNDGCDDVSYNEYDDDCNVADDANDSVDNDDED